MEIYDWSSQLFRADLRLKSTLLFKQSHETPLRNKKHLSLTCPTLLLS